MRLTKTILGRLALAGKIWRLTEAARRQSNGDAFQSTRISMPHAVSVSWQKTLWLGAVILWTWFLLSPTMVWAHDCDPTKAGRVRIIVGGTEDYFIEPEQGETCKAEYKIEGPGDVTIATVTLKTQIALRGEFTIKGLKEGKTTVMLSWRGTGTDDFGGPCGGGATCTVEIEVFAPGRDASPNRNLGPQEPQNNPTPPSSGGDVGRGDIPQGSNLLSSFPSPGTSSGVAQDSGDPIYLHNGEFYLYQVDLEIPGRGFNWRFERKYRSGVTFNGPMGHNWEFNYHRRLLVEIGGALRMDGYGRADRYQVEGRGISAPTGFYTQLLENRDGTFVERDRNGTKVIYSRPDANGIARMTEMRDRNGNRMRFEYNAQGQLVRVIDTLGRPIDYLYNQAGLLIEVRDFSGRSIKFEYDENEDLVAVTSPAVTGTPHGNNFPQGKTTRYTYSSGLNQEILNHNLLTITAPNEVASGGGPRVRIEYDTDPNSPNLDRVLRQTVGGTNTPAELADGQIRFRQDQRIPAGGTISYAYQFLSMAPENDFISPVSQTTVTDRNGNRTEYQFNQLGNIVRIREFTNRDIRPNDPEFFETRFEYNRDGEMTRVIYPEGNSVEYVYDEQNGDRLRQGNLLAVIRRPDPPRGSSQAGPKR